jgi:hypothetical protein
MAWHVMAVERKLMNEKRKVFRVYFRGETIFVGWPLLLCDFFAVLVYKNREDSRRRWWEII